MMSLRLSSPSPASSFDLRSPRLYAIASATAARTISNASRPGPGPRLRCCCRMVYRIIGVAVLSPGRWELNGAREQETLSIYFTRRTAWWLEGDPRISTHSRPDGGVRMEQKRGHPWPVVL